MKRLLERISPGLPQGRRSVVLLLAALLVVGGPPALGQGGPTMREAWADPIGVLASDLSYDADRIFRFVADEIRYEPYPGILRGARGTLAARAGNSVDKALLLGALLDASLIRYRYARGPLDAATSTALLDSLVVDVDDARRIARDPLIRGLEQVRAAGEALRPAEGGQLAEIERDASAVEADAPQRLETAAAHLGSTVMMIEGALESAGIDLRAGTVLSLPHAETAAHTWVQMSMGHEWVDLDPALPGSQMGVTPIQAAEMLTELPDDLRHAIEFGVLLETLTGGRLATTEVLTHTGYADELAETPVTFAHGTPSGFQQLGVSLGDLIGEGWIDYRPALFVGDERSVANGRVLFPSGDGSDIFGSAPSGAAGGPVEGEATAEWLEVRVTSPGSDPEVMRRMVFDRLPADLRAAGVLDPSAVAPIELVDDGSGSTDFLPMLGVRTFAIATGPTSPVSIATVSEDPLGMFATAYHTVRDAMSATVGLDAGARTYVDGPNIVSLTVDPVGHGGSGIARLGLDVWRRDHGVLPVSAPAIGPARSQLIAGVLGHVAERVAIEHLGDDASMSAAETGVGVVFDAAASQGIPTLVLQGSVPDSLPYGPAAMGLMRDAVASGDVVVVPAEPVLVGDQERVGWWRVDPRTGVTTDAMDDGSGSSAGEYVIIVDEELGAIKCEGAMARAVALAIIDAASLLGAYGNTALYWLYNDGFQGVTCTA